MEVCYEEHFGQPWTLRNVSQLDGIADFLNGIGPAAALG
jgi:hypothetical protein